jgi:hypothetical protein
MSLISIVSGDITWIKPSLLDERGELERTSEEWEIPLELLLDAFDVAELTRLQDSDWKRMVNCDSSDLSWTIEEVRAHLAGFRDFERIERGLRSGGRFPVPVVLYRRGHRPNLLAGNSRLLGCRTLRIRPVIFSLFLEDVGRENRVV